MKALVILFGLVVIGAAFADDFFGWKQPQTYDDDAKLKALYKCLIGSGTCANRYTRDRFSGILETGCGDCSTDEKSVVAYVINRIAQVNRSDLYELLKVRGPGGKYSKEFLKFVQRVSEERGYPKLSDDVINGLPDSS